MRNWWKRSLVLCLTLLMTLTPWAASWAEQTTATGQITATVQLDAEGLAEAIRLVEPGWDEEDQQLLACLTALANAARLEYVYAQDGSWIRAGIYLSDQEIWYSLMEEREDGIYQTSSLYSGVVLRYSADTYSDLQGVAEAMPWGDIAKFVSYDAQVWLDSQRVTVEEKGGYQTEVLSDADILRSYQITDRDLAVLMDAWLYTLLDQEQIGEAFDVAFGEVETFSDFVAELIFHNHETAMDNRNLYQMDLYEKDGANVGLSVSGRANRVENAPEEWRVQAGWNHEHVDVLGTMALDKDTGIMGRATLTSPDDNTLTARLHILSMENGQTYDEASKAPQDEALFEESTVIEINNETDFQAKTTGTGVIRVGETALNMNSNGTLTMNAAGEAAISSETRLDAGTLMYGFNVQMTTGADAPELPDYETLTMLDVDFQQDEQMFLTDLADAMEKSFDDFIIRLYKAMPDECIDIMTEMIFQQQ